MVCFQGLAILRVSRRIFAMKIHASADAMVRSKSFASLRRPSHANVRSTIQRRGRISKPLALSEHLTISGVNLPTLASLPRSFGPARRAPETPHHRQHGIWLEEQPRHAH